MITISGLLRDYIITHPFLEKMIGDGLINISALGRKLKPEVEKRLLRNVSDSAMIMALTRIIPKVSKTEGKLDSLKGKINDITLKSNISEFTFRNSDTLLDSYSELLGSVGRESTTFLTITHGLFETTLLAETGMTDMVKRIFHGESMISYLDDLASIILKLPESSYNSPGIYYDILKQLAWRNINVVEVVSTLNEFSIIIDGREIDTAFSILKNHLMV